MWQLKCYLSLGSFWKTATYDITNDTWCGCTIEFFSKKKYIKNQKNYSNLFEIQITKQVLLMFNVLYFSIILILHVSWYKFKIYATKTKNFFYSD